MNGTAALRVFISYRREDSAGYAGRLHDSLSSQLPAADVFMDVGGIELGVDFTTAIANAVASCDVMLALIGPRWMTAATTAGNRRLDEPDDYVVAEIAAALERDLRVIPVLLEGAPMPEAADLPDRIRGLARRNAVTLDTVSWPTDLEGILSALRRLRPQSTTQERSGSDDIRTANGGGDREGAPQREPTGVRRLLAHRNRRWVVAVLAAVGLALVGGMVLAGGGPQDDGSTTPQAVLVTPASGPVGTTLTVSGGPCPAIPAGRRPNGVFFGLHDPRAEPGKENPATSGVPLVSGEPWKGQLRIPAGTAVGGYFVYAGCFVVDDPKAFYEYNNAAFEVVES